MGLEIAKVAPRSFVISEESIFREVLFSVISTRALPQPSARQEGSPLSSVGGGCSSKPGVLITQRSFAHVWGQTHQGNAERE